jgi:hypothetical protein
LKSDNRFRLGLALTALWLAVMTFFIFIDFSTTKAMKPNEWGDFFAGFFAPLAFLWLVLGYLQQGQELQLSTKALHLQAEELKNSVEQQRELVEVTRQQVESEREALSLERISRKEAARPRFVLQNAGGSFSFQNFKYGISISNAGNIASQVHISIEGKELQNRTIVETPIIGRSATVRNDLLLQQRFPESGAIITINYLDAAGEPGQEQFLVKTADDSPHASLIFAPIKDTSFVQS